jgi:hypothetical protein
MSLLADIIDDVTDGTRSVADALRRCRILSARLHHDDLKNWTDRELNGYRDKAEIPDYRRIATVARGNFDAGYGIRLTNRIIPSALIEANLREYASTSYLLQPIAAFECLLRDGKEDSLVSHWPSNLIFLYRDKIIEEYTLTDAWQIIPKSSIVSMLEIVRNRLLGFALEMEIEYGDIELLAEDQKRQAKSDITEQFTTIILGGTNVVGSEVQTINQIARLDISRGDVDGLLSVVRSIGLTSEAIEELVQVVEGEPVLDPEGNYGPRLAAWLGKTVSKAAMGTLKVSVDVGTTILTKAISKYYGLDV